MGEQVSIAIVADAAKAMEGFKQVIDGSQKLAKDINSLGKSGTDVSAALKQIGEQGGPAFQQLIAKSQEEGVSIRQLQQQLRTLNQEVRNGAIEGARATQEQIVKWELAGEAAKELARKVFEMARELIESAHKADELQESLEQAFGKDLAPHVFENIKRLNELTGISEDQLVQAAKAMQRFGQYSEETFNLIVNAARGAGTGIEEALTAFSKFEEKMDERNAKGFFKAFGVDPEAVAQQLGLLDREGKILLDTKDKALAYGVAMKEALSGKAKLAAEQQQDAAERLGAKWKHFRDEAIGKPLLDSLDYLAEKLEKVTDATEESDDGIDKFYQHANELATFAPGAVDRIEAAKAIGARKRAEAAKKGAEEEKQSEAEKAVKAHETAQIMVEVENVKTSAASNTKAQQIAAIEAVVTKYGNGSQLMSKAEQDRLGLTLEGNKELTKNLHELATERVKLAKELATEELAERLKTGQTAIQTELAQGKLSETQAAERYQKLKNMAGLHADQIADLELKSVELKKKAQESALAAEIHDLENRRKNSKLTAAQEITSLQEILARHGLTTDQRMRLEDKLTEATKAAVNERQQHELRSLEIRKAQGAATIEDEIELLKKQAADPDLSQEQRDAKNLEAANKQKEATDYRIGQEKELAKIQADRIKAEEASIQQDVTNNEAGAVDKKVELIHQRYAMERKELADLQAQEDTKHRRTKEATDLLNAKLQQSADQEAAEVRATGEERLSYIRKVRDEYEKLKADQEDKPAFKGGGQSVAEAFGGGNFGFSLDTKKKPSAPALPGGVDPAAIAALLNNPDLDPNDPAVQAIYNQLTSKNKAGAGTNLGKLQGAGGSKIGTDAQGNRVLIPGAASGGSDMDSAAAATATGGTLVPSIPPSAGPTLPPVIPITAPAGPTNFTLNGANVTILNSKVTMQGNGGNRSGSGESYYGEFKDRLNNTVSDSNP